MLQAFLYGLARFLISFRYRVQVKGLEKITPEQLIKKGGVLLLPNHVAYIDPMIITALLWKKWRLRPLVIEYVYFVPALHWLLSKVMRAVPMPDFKQAMNSYKVRRVEKALKEISKDLSSGDHFLIYPSGRLKRSGEEIVGGASAIYDLLQANPEVNVVLARTTGLWGSMFSLGLTGSSPQMGPVFSKIVKILCKNLLFFTPKRHVTIELELVTLPINKTKAELNHFLEEWYNRPFPRSFDPARRKTEPLTLVSYSLWREEFPQIIDKCTSNKIDLSAIPPSVSQKVIADIARLSRRRPSDISPEMHFFADLGLDSLDTAELLSSLDRDFIGNSSVELDTLTVGEVMALAAGQYKSDKQDYVKPLDRWKESAARPGIAFATGQTLQEAFLLSCDRMGSAVACCDAIAGVLTYRELKMRVLLVAEILRQYPGNRIGIMLPASVGAQILILAALMAGKIPVMINWTLGARYLETVKSATGIDRVLTSWAFLDRLESVDLSPIDEMIQTFEDVRMHMTLFDKLRAFRRSKYSPQKLLKMFHLQHVHPDESAVVLFTSGTEALPKAVPLSHRNLLTNQKGAAEAMQVNQNDVVFSFLPPFHALGFAVTGLLPLYMGLKACYSPNPGDSARLAQEIERYGATIICSAPTFLKGIFHFSKPGQLSTARLFVCGAEKTPTELFRQVERLEHAQLLEGYGITECGPILSVNRPGKPLKGVGPALNEVELSIAHPDTLEILAEGETGLILARGPNIFSGYLGSAKDPFVNINGKRWYNTGDLGWLDKEGNLTIAGRLKRFVKMGGEMISLPAIEEGLMEAAIQKGWSSVSQQPMLAVVAREQENERPLLCLFANFPLDVDRVNHALKEQGFSNLIKISCFNLLKEMPLTGIGKCDYLNLQKIANQLDVDLYQGTAHA